METLLKKPLWTLPLLLLVILAFFPWTAEAQEEGYAFRLSNFSLELLGGYAGLNPKDLNAGAAYEEAYLQYYYVTRFKYYHSLYGDSYRVTSSRADDAQFKTLTDSPLYGLRLRYNLSPSLGLSIGVQYMNRSQNSNVAMSVDVLDSTGSNTNTISALNYQYQNSGFLLAVSAWAPQLAAHFGWDIGRLLRLEVLLAGGPLYVQCRTLSERRTTTTDQTGNRMDSLYALEMTGKATGASVEMGGRACLRLSGFLNVFAEGSFTFREVDEVTGAGSSRTTVSDSNGAQDLVTASWNGQWSLLLNDSTASWGRFRAYQPQNRVTTAKGTPFQKFAVNLSGFQLKAGLAFRL